MGYSVDLRERIVEAVRERNFSIHEAAATFRVGHATVARYLRGYRERGELTPDKPPGRPSRVAGEQLHALKQQLEAHNELTLMEHCELWQHDTGMKLSYVTMHRLSNRLGVSRKKRRSQPRLRPQAVRLEAMSEQDPLARLLWLAEVLKHDPKRLVFIDESGFNLRLQPSDVTALRTLSQRPARLRTSAQKPWRD